jgi:Rod binding domain-containing protein
MELNPIQILGAAPPKAPPSQLTTPRSAETRSADAGSGETRSAASVNSAEALKGASGKSEVREAFDSFVGETFYAQMLKSMRKTVTKPAYFHGGRGEEVFRSQLDQVLAEKMAKADSGGLSDSMFEQFSLQSLRRR